MNGTNAPTNPYVIVDFETTGLDHARAYPLELAAIVLTPTLEIVGEFSRVLLDARNAPADVFEQGAMDLHAKNGLTAAIANGDGVTIDQARDEIAAFLMTAGLKTRAIMIGNLPAFDRGFLKRFFPEIHEGLHYRMIDVSTLRELAAMRSGLATDRLKRALAHRDAPHRALDDCRFALQELRFYAACFDGKAIVDALRSQGELG